MPNNDGATQSAGFYDVPVDRWEAIFGKRDALKEDDSRAVPSDEDCANNKSNTKQ